MIYHHRVNSITTKPQSINASSQPSTASNVTNAAYLVQFRLTQRCEHPWRKFPQQAVGLQSPISESPSHLSRGLKNRGGFTRVIGAGWISELGEGEQTHRAAFAMDCYAGNRTWHNHSLRDFPKDLATPWNRRVRLKRLRSSRVT